MCAYVCAHARSCQFCKRIKTPPKGKYLPLAVKNFEAMKKSADNIKHFLRRGTPINIHSSNFQFYELADLARLARSCETKLTITVGDNINFGEASQLVDAAGGYIAFVIPDD